MTIKTKVRLGVIFLFAVILGIGGVGLFYLNRLSNESQNILADNYESLQYTKSIMDRCDSANLTSEKNLLAMDSVMRFQEANITESGERKFTSELRVVFERMRNAGVNSKDINEMRRLSLDIQELNMQAIKKKNETTQRTASNASTYLIVIATICTLTAFTFIINFPGYVANPISQLTRSIKSIAGKNYEERLHFDRKDEFEELAEAFNRMAEKLDEYEHSNLAKVIFEKKRIETIINRMSDPVIGLDQTNKIIFANDEATEILNLERSRIIDHYAPDVALENDLLRNLIKTDHSSEQSALIKAVVKGKENYYSREAIAVNYTPTGEKDKVNIGTVILLKNVTSYKELDLAKTNFIATISHELKTPIASLQMCVKLLQDTRVGELNGEQKNITQTLSDEVSRLSKITNELLDLSQVETGNIKLSIRPSDPNDLVMRALEAVKFQSERKHISIDYPTSSEMPRIQADADKTTWVLVNLLTNAIRHSHENGVVKVMCQQSDGSVQFIVTDYGDGIEQKHLGRIFEKFFQVPGTPNGTGLGLAISKEFIEAQGGKIHVSSEVGKGSTFSFELLKAN
ncbi:ATP-binding protein [Chryseolinea sp. T2]|uniref:ATP-binding protein n=1 Tax=Chryseolinea sp. T2 TaxID=3129255 RepID=UPI0030770029